MTAMARLSRWHAIGDHEEGLPAGSGDPRPPIYYEAGLRMRGFRLTMVQPKSRKGQEMILALDDRDARELMAALREFLIDNRSVSEAAALATNEGAET